jgi:hypothetical protein
MSNIYRLATKAIFVGIGLAHRHIERVFFFKMLAGGPGVEDALSGLDTFTQDKARIAIAIAGSTMSKTEQY